MISTVFVGGYIDKAVMVTFLLVTMICLARHSDQIRLDALAFLMCFAALFAAGYGLLNYPSLRYYLSHLGVAALMIVYYVVGCSCRWDRGMVNRAVAAFSHVLVAIYAVLITAFWILYYNGETRYLGLSCQYLLLPLAYYLSRKNILWPC